MKIKLINNGSSKLNICAFLKKILEIKMATGTQMQTVRAP
jgi:hypothetical protein